jgi:hypothetical protein
MNSSDKLPLLPTDLINSREWVNISVSRWESSQLWPKTFSAQWTKKLYSCTEYSPHEKHTSHNIERNHDIHQFKHGKQMPIDGVESQTSPAYKNRRTESFLYTRHLTL